MADLMPTTTDDQQRQQLISSFFMTMGAILDGTDSQPRFEPGMSGGSQGGTVLGPATTSEQLGVGQGGEVYVRGASGQVGAIGSRDVAKGSGLKMNMLLLIAAAVFLIRKL